MLSAPPGPLPHAHWRAGNSAHITATTVGGVLRTAASRTPRRAALIAGERQWSYADLLAEAEGTARALLACFDPGDAVAVWADNCAEWVILEFAAGICGITLVPLHPSAGAEEIALALAHSGAKGLFIGTDSGDSPKTALLRRVERRLPALKFVIPLCELDALRAIGSLGLPGNVRSLPEVDPDGVAQILYTSGASGRPKAVLLTHRALTNNARLATTAFGGQDGEVVVNPLPLSNAAGCGLMTLGTAQLGGTHVLMPRFDAGLQLALVDKHRGTLLCGLPGMLTAMQGHLSFGIRDLTSVRAVISGGGQITPDFVLGMETALGVPVLTALTQTECGCVITATTPEDTLADRICGTGRPLPGTEVKIADLRTGGIAGCGMTGEICVRGYQVMRGYLDDPAATAAAIGPDGWLRTGDLGSMDERGYVRVAGRLRELIVRGGQHVYPHEVEAVLLGHPDVAEAAVVGVRDKFWGETVAAVVRLCAPLDQAAATLSEHCGARLSPHKVPVRWLFTDKFPRTADGKIRKDALGARLADTSALPWTDETAAALAADLADHRRDRLDLVGPVIELLGLRVPRQERRAKALEDIDF